MTTTFNTFTNNARGTLASPYTAGAGSLALAAGQGAQFGSTFPIRVTVVTAASYQGWTEVLTIFAVTGRTGDTLTGVAAVEGTADQAFAAGAIVELRWTAGEANLVSSAITRLENYVDVASIATAGAGTQGSPYTGWDSALAAAMADNMVFLFNGWFAAAANIVCDGRNNVRLVGREFGGSGATPANPVNPTGTGASGADASIILFTGEGPNVSFVCTSGCGISGVTIWHTTNGTLSTAMVSASGRTPAHPDNITMGFTIRDTTLNASGTGWDGTALCCLLLDNTVKTTLDNVVFLGGQYGVLGMHSGYFATAVTIRGGIFEGQATVPIGNPHMQWLLENVVFEPAAGAGGAWIKADNGGMGGAVQDLTLLNCYQWDVGNTPTGILDVITLNVAANNLTMIGCTTCSVGGTVIKLKDGYPISGLVLCGNSFQNNLQGPGKGTLFPVSGWSSAQINNALIAANTFQSGFDNVASAVTGGQIISGMIVDSAGQVYLPAATPLMLGANRITFGSAAPATGTWAKGDVCYNTGVTSTTSPAWSCTTAGTSGVWTAWPNL